MKQRVSRLAYAATVWFSRGVVYWLGRWEVVGRDRVPSAGPVILVANHNHLLDPPLVAASCGRRVHPMAKRELFETPFVGWYFWVYGAFPVRRFSGDMGALRVARNYLRNGEVVLMFPEGTRAHGRGMRAALPGAAMVALLSHAPVVPVAITATDTIRIPLVFVQWLIGRRPRLRVEFGEPFSLESGEADARSAEESTDRMMRRVAAMLPERYQGAYGAASAGTIVVARQSRDRRAPSE
ncbi:MAG: 1-acyl-sn-glycerol-3-phosphate acyltransferase [Chloroflexi bacterium]|nr:1-acyl-sn-glycerol-3-phosphate acyltransferase [Chloroflexota bacterium]